MDSRLVGTPCYMDPEYLRTGRFGPKSDVYSMGEHTNKECYGWVGRGGGAVLKLTSMTKTVWLF
jgi:serine/threonine protein kinase